MGFDRYWLSVPVGALLLVSGCAGPAGRPGRGSVASAEGFRAEVVQPSNPAATSFQRVRETIFLPKTPQDRFSQAGRGGDTPAEALALGGAAGSVQVVREAETSLGPAHRDAGAEIAARLASFRPIQYLGALVFLAGVAALAWPPARALVGSVTTAAAVAGAGLALVFLPTLVIGREAWILALAASGAGAWGLAHRHGKARGELEELRRGRAPASPSR